MEKEVSMMIID
jgi:hypothetical protein